MAERILSYRVVPIMPVLFDFEPEMDWGYRFCKYPVLIDGRHIECLVQTNVSLKDLCKSWNNKTISTKTLTDCLGVTSRLLDQLLFRLKHGQQVKVEKIVERPRVQFGRPILVKGGLDGPPFAHKGGR